MMSDQVPPSGGFLNSQLDVSKTALRTINYLDDQISRGLVYNFSTTLAATAGVSNFFTSEVVDPDNDILTVTFFPVEVNPVDGYAIMYIYEDTDYDGGVQQDLIARNRVLYNSGAIGDAKSELYAGATGTDKGTLLFTYTFGTAAAPTGKGGGGAGNTINAILLDPSKKYLYEIVASEDTTIGTVGEIGEVERTRIQL